MYENTGSLPAALANRPTLDLVWRWPYSVWQELSGGRVYNKGAPAQILFSEVALYGTYHGCSRAETATLWHDIHSIDKAWQTEVSKMLKDQGK
jgi:hypothetical protein